MHINIDFPCHIGTSRAYYSRLVVEVCTSDKLTLFFPNSIGGMLFISDIKNPAKSTKRVCRPELTNPPPSLSANQLESSAISKVTDGTNQFIDHEDCCFGPRRFFASLPDRNSMLFVADSTEDNLLLDLPSKASFPEAQLLCHPWEQKMNQNSSTRESRVEACEQPSSSFSNR